MLNIQSLFEIPDYEAWIKKLKHDLSDEEYAKLSAFDPIEEIHLTAHAHADLLTETTPFPGVFPYTRGFNTPSNEWKNGKYILVSNETEANILALDYLMKGCDLLVFDLPNHSVDLSKLLSGIGLAYIHTQFEIRTLLQWKNLIAHFSGDVPLTVTFNIDPITLSEDDFNEIALFLKNKQFHTFNIKANKVLEAGAASFQELAFCLSAGHHTLFKLIQCGLNVDEASACIHFSVGIGSNYFNELAKFRTLRLLWTNIVDAYTPQHACSYYCSVTAHTIAMNKSLSDPYTNLLRQTTEAMSAISGGVQSLIVYPYDHSSNNPSSPLAQRMALNISLLLKEESHLDAVNDPLGGSYTIELITNALSSNAWTLFKSLEDMGGIQQEQALHYFKEKVNEKYLLRIAQFKGAEKIYIGINKFQQPDNNTLPFKPIDKYLGMQALIFERYLSLQS